MANGDNVNLWGQVNRGLPGAVVDNSYGPVRITRRGELVTVPLGKWRHVAADEGTYFVAHNPVNSLATIAGHPAPALVDADATTTKAFIHLRMEPQAIGLRAYLDYLEIEVIQAGTGGTSDNWSCQLDTGLTRMTSGGTPLVSVNPSMQSSADAALVCNAGAIVVGPESTGVRDLGFGQFRPSNMVAGDKYIFLFGAEPEAYGAQAPAAAGSIARHTVGLGPAILGPTDQLILALYSPSQSAAAIYKARLGWMER